MFIGDEVLLGVSYAAARAALKRLTDGGALLRPAKDAYDHGAKTTTRVGVPGLSKLVTVQARELAETADCAGLAIRWEAAGPGGRLFPVLDADIRLADAGHELTLLTLSGTYRPPLGPLGEALDRAALHKLAAATVRNFISRVASELTEDTGTDETITSGASNAGRADTG